MIDPRQVIKLAQEVEQSDPIDWANLPLERDVVYNMLAMSVLEQAYNTEDQDQREYMLMASLVKLTVENFILELKLRNTE
jgi:hypothetical protein